MEIMLIDLCPGEKTVRVVCRNKEEFILEPRKPIYYDAMEQVARLQQNEDRKLVLADEVCTALDQQVKDHNTTPVVPTEWNVVGRKAATLYKNWKERFLEGYWEVKSVDGKKINPEAAKEILQAVFYRHSGSNERALLRVGDTTNVKVVIGGGRSWRSIGEACKAQVKSAVKHVGLDLGPEYVTREAALGSLNAFLTSNKTLFVLVGSAGTGKSSFMTSFVRSLEVPTVYLPGALYASSGLQVQAEVVKLLNAFLEPGSGGDSVRKALSVQEFSFLEEMTAVNDSCFVVVIDGVNQCHGADATTEEILRLASTVQARGTRLKFIVSCRAERWQRLVERVIVPPHCLFHQEERKGDAREEEKATYSFCLAEFDDRELKAAVAAYRRRYGFRGELTSQVKEVCRLPLLLHFLAEAFAGRELPKEANAAKIYEAYWEYVLRGAPEGTDRFLLAVASEMRRFECTELAEDEELRSTPHFDSERLNHLMDARVLVRRSTTGGNRVAFWHEKVLEYVLARYLLCNKEEVLDRLDDLLEERSRFPPLWGGVLQIFTMTERGFQGRFLWGAAKSDYQPARWAVCEAMAHMQELPDDTPTLLAFLVERFPSTMAAEVLQPAVSERFGLDEELTRVVATSLDKVPSEEWSYRRREIVDACQRYCLESWSSRCVVEAWATHRSARLRQLALGTLVLWPDRYRCQIRKTLDALVAGEDQELQQCAASVLPSLAKSDPELVTDAVNGLAGSRDGKVRNDVEWSLAWSALNRAESRQLLAELAASPVWERRRVAAGALGRALTALEGGSWWKMARALASDEKEEVRNNLASALWEGLWVEARGAFTALGKNAVEAEEILERVIAASSSDISFPHQGPLILNAEVPQEEDTLSQNCLERWSRSGNERLNLYAARMWSCKYGKESMAIAWRLARSDSAAVRRELVFHVGWARREKARDAVKIVRELLNDSVRSVQSAAWRALEPLCNTASKEVASILWEKVKKGDELSRFAACYRAVALVEKEPGEAADLICGAMISSPPGSLLTVVGVALGRYLDEGTGVPVFERLAASQSEPQHHVVGVAAARAIRSAYLVEDARRAILRAWAHVIECGTWRAQIPAIGSTLHWIEPETQGARWWEAPSRVVLGSLVAFLRVGRQSPHWISRAWSAACLWKLAREREPFRDASIRLLDALSIDPDWKVRFAVATRGVLELGSLRLRLYRGQLEGSDRRVPPAIATGAAHLYDRLGHDATPLVAEAASLWTEALDENWNDARNETLNNRARSLVAQFCCEDYEHRMAELEWEIDAIDEAHVDTLLMIRRLRQAETDGLVASWKTSRSRPLHKAASEYFGLVGAINP